MQALPAAPAAFGKSYSPASHALGGRWPRGTQRGARHPHPEPPFPCTPLGGSPPREVTSCAPQLRTHPQLPRSPRRSLPESGCTTWGAPSSPSSNLRSPISGTPALAPPPVAPAPELCRRRPPRCSRSLNSGDPPRHPSSPRPGTSGTPVSAPLLHPRTSGTPSRFCSAESATLGTSRAMPSPPRLGNFGTPAPPTPGPELGTWGPRTAPRSPRSDSAPAPRSLARRLCLRRLRSHRGPAAAAPPPASESPAAPPAGPARGGGRGREGRGGD
jgi:hypothetical protein